jgi:hypothetical protein
MMHDILAIDIRGSVDQSGLDRLRDHLDLHKYGRLTDDWDEQFGYRKIERPDGNYTKIVLYRNFEGAWGLEVMDTETVNLSAEETAQLCSELIEGITAAGYEATVKRGPTSA